MVHYSPEYAAQPQVEGQGLYDPYAQAGGRPPSSGSHSSGQRRPISTTLQAGSDFLRQRADYPVQTPPLAQGPYDPYAQAGARPPSSGSHYGMAPGGARTLVLSFSELDELTHLPASDVPVQPQAHPAALAVGGARPTSTGSYHNLTMGARTPPFRGLLLRAWSLTPCSSLAYVAQPQAQGQYDPYQQQGGSGRPPSSGSHHSIPPNGPRALGSRLQRSRSEY